MTRRPLALAFGVAAVCAVASLALLRGGHTGTTFALFNAETSNSGSVFAAGWLTAPTSLAATPQGNDVQLTWTGGTHGPPTGQSILGVDNGSSSSCGSASLATLATVPYLSGANTYVDAGGTSSGSGSGRGTSSNAGHWFCYAVASTAGTRWTTATSAVPVQLGLFAQSVSISNANGTIAAGDTVTITFNQQPNLTSGTVTVCAVAGGGVIVGDTTATGSTACAAGDSYSIAKLTTTGTIGATVEFASSTSTVAAGSGSTYTVTVSLGGTSSTASVTPGSWSFTPASSIKSAAGTGSQQASICTSCSPTPSGGF